MDMNNIKFFSERHTYCHISKKVHLFYYIATVKAINLKRFYSLITISIFGFCVKCLLLSRLPVFSVSE